MAGIRTREKHLMRGLYVKRGRRSDTYYTLIDRRYFGLGTDRKAAERRLRDMQAGRPVDGTIADVCGRYLAAMRAAVAAGDEDAIAPRTLTDYAEAIAQRLVPVFGHMRPQDFKPAHAAQYLEAMRRKGRAVRANREVSALSAVFAYAMRHGIVDRNPCHGVRRNRERPRDRRPMIAEVNSFLELARSRGERSYMVALIGVMTAVTGRRRAEVMGLTLHALTDDGIRVAEAKAKPGEVPRSFLVGWSPFLRDVVAAARAIPRPVESLMLFPTRNGTAYTDQGFKAMWARIMGAYVAGGGERFTAHDLRALYVTEMVERGEDPATHRNPATTARVYDRRRVVKVAPLA